MDRQKAGDAVKFKYTNHRGEVAIRRVRIGTLIFKNTQWHPLQWVMRGWDEDRKQVRDFALKDCDFTTTSIEDYLKGNLVPPEVTQDFETPARAAGWEFDGGVYHDHRDGNNTGDPVEYVDSWEDACDVSRIGPKYE